MPLTLTVLPLGALVTGAVMLFVPLVLLMMVWTVVTMVRILFPERPIPLTAAHRRQRNQRMGIATPVRLHDLLDDEARRPAPPGAAYQPGEQVAPHDLDPLLEDLWLRRN
jgi:hypothetical protein